MYSLISVVERNGNKADGYWVQNHSGTLETARQRAKDTEAVNSNKITIVVVPEVPSPVPMLEYWTGLTIL